MTAGKGGHKRLLGIDQLWVAQIRRSGSSLHLVPAIKTPGVIAIVGLVLEIGRSTPPGEGHFVFGHAFK